jgi:hypothetical protein
MLLGECFIRCRHSDLHCRAPPTTNPNYVYFSIGSWKRWAAMGCDGCYTRSSACPVLQLRPHLHNTNSFPPILLRQKLLFGIADRFSFPKLELVAFSSFGQLAQSQFAPGFPSLVVHLLLAQRLLGQASARCQKLRQQSQITRN